jgi:serine/threonine-protein kinase RsbW
MRKKLGRNTNLVRKSAPPQPAGELVFDRQFDSTDAAKSQTLEALLTILSERGMMPTDNEESRMRLCLDEALRNAVMHGNAYNSSKKARARAFLSGTSWTVIVDDEGGGFREEDLPDPDAPENMLEESGRGVHLIRSMMDEVSYWNNGATLLIVRKVPSPPATGGGA